MDPPQTQAAVREEAFPMPGAVADEPPPPAGRKETPSVPSQFLSVGREAQGFALGLGQGNGGEKASSEAVPGPGPASLASSGGGAYAGASDGSGEGQRMTIHGMFFHAMISYRVASEGDGGTGLSTAIYDSLTRVSLERQHRLPPSLWGEWPSFAKPPSIGLGKAAKVYLDAACLEEGWPWEAGSKGVGGFAGALRCSIVFLPLLSFAADGGGSLGQMVRLEKEDYCDNVLLEFTVALGVWRSGRLPLRSIMPVLVGHKDNRGIYSAFPFGEVARLPDTPSAKTNARAAEILRRFGLEEEAERVHGSTVRGVVSKVLSFQGVQLSNEGVHSKAVRAVAERALQVARKHVVEGMEAFLLKDRLVKTLSVGTPCGYEVLEWLDEVGLGRYAVGFAETRVDSMLIAANLCRSDLERIVAHTKQHYHTQFAGGGGGAQADDWEGKGARDGGLEVRPGDVVDLELAVRGLKGDKRAKTMKERTLWYLEESEHGKSVAMHRAEGLETVISTPAMDKLHIFGAFFWTAFLVVPLVAVWSRRFTVMPHDSDLVYIVTIGVVMFWTWTNHTFTSFVFGLPPPTNLILAVKISIGFVNAFLVVWLWEALYFTGERAAPDTFLRRVRYPVFFVMFEIWIPLLSRFARGMLVTYGHTVSALVFFAFCSAGCFLGEDPDSNVMAWVFFAFVVFFVVMILLALVGSTKTRREAVDLVSPEMSAFGRAWEAALGAEGGEAAERALSQSCREVQGACEEEARAFEATVPRFGKHVWWITIPIVREGAFTPSGKPRQAVSDLDVLFRQARAVNPHFQDWVKSWAGWGNGVRYVPGPVKHAGRVIEKCIRAYGRDAAAITDLVRCTVAYPALQGVLDFFAALRERSDAGGIGMLRIRRVKNRLSRDHDAAKSVGYRDCAILVEVGWLERGDIVEFVPVKDWGKGTSRHICEIQVHVNAIHEIKQGSSREKYVMYRDMIAS